MAIDSDAVISQQIKDLAAAVSTQAQVSNRIWLGLVTVAVISLLPQAPNTSSVPLPFGLSSVPAAWFYLVLFGLLIVLTIAFASADTQQVRARKLAFRFIDSIPNHAEFAGMHPQELFDMFRLPCFNRVAPLAQSIRGKFEFYSGKASCPTYRVVASAFYYALLKLISMAVYFGVPAFALLRTYEKIQNVSFTSKIMVRGSGVVAAVTLFQVFLSDLLYSIKVLRKISSKE
ncbi:MAG TPA: hypothetical protein VN976_14815 [Verrucomicrobiae bacterium]|nr:hypothetical protein [Verrucomicrobiae bacterium]